MAFDGAPRVTAVLGPTNTGKTHYAIERMLAHRTGVIGLPLRLLAREVYDRIVALARPLGGGARHRRGAHRAGARRLLGLHRRGDAARPRRRLPGGRRDPALRRPRPRPCLHRPAAARPRPAGDAVPRLRHHARRASRAWCRAPQFQRRERFSQLSYTGARKISRMPPRSAIVGFSVEDVYAIAELIRRQKGGAAVVMGALCPRTRNAQVALYQNGDVDHLVATDAIGMGLNLDIAHVAFSGLVEVRRPPAPPPRRRTSSRRSPGAPGATPPTAPSASPARRRRSTPRWSRRSRATASAPLAPAAVAQLRGSTSPRPRR